MRVRLKNGFHLKDLRLQSFIHSAIYTLEDERDLGVRLKNGLDLKDLKAGESFIFEPNIEKGK